MKIDISKDLSSVIDPVTGRGPDRDPGLDQDPLTNINPSASPQPSQNTFQSPQT